MGSSSTNVMKATGIIHMIHGSLLGILTLIFIFPLGIVPLLLIYGGISFLYIYIGYELYALRSAGKMKGLLITSLVFSSLEVAYSLGSGQMAGIFFIIEFVMAIIALCNISDYEKYKMKMYKKAYRAKHKSKSKSKK